MKLNIRTVTLFEKPENDDGGNEIGNQELVDALPSTRFNISNEDELTQALEDSVKQILLQIHNLEASTSNLRFKKDFINNHSLWQIWSNKSREIHRITSMD